MALSVAGATVRFGRPIEDHVAEVLRNFVTESLKEIQNLRSESDDYIGLVFLIPKVHGLKIACPEKELWFGNPQDRYAVIGVYHPVLILKETSVPEMTAAQFVF